MDKKEMNAEEIELYLTELGEELRNRGIQKPVRILLIGGAYMLLLANAPRPTYDVDILWLEEDVLQRAYHHIRESVQAVKNKYDLDGSWFNYLAQTLMYDEVFVPNGKLWKKFGALHVYIPSKEYILTLKIAAGRDKDLADCAILLSKTKIRTRKQAEQLLEKYLSSYGREKNAEAIENSLQWLFERK